MDSTSEAFVWPPDAGERNMDGSSVGDGAKQALFSGISVDEGHRAQQGEQFAPGLGQWLRGLEPEGFLCEYVEALAMLKIRSSAEAAATYVRNGALVPEFFIDVGIQKLGHRRLFERWCQSLCT